MYKGKCAYLAPQVGATPLKEGIFMDQTPAAGRIMDSIRGGHCIVLGFGVSNRPLVTWLCAHGAASVTVRDKRGPDALTDDERRILADTGSRYVGGAEYLTGLDDEVRSHGSAVIFRSPGFRPDEGHLAAAVRAGGLPTSEMELFFELTPATVLGVTGSDGKTTTTTVTSLLVDRILKTRGRGRMYLGGNIGTPLLPLVDGMTADDVAVLELSSFQLMTMTCSPVRAAITNLSPNHLNWHTDMDEYIAAKTNILTHDLCAGAVLNAQNEHTVRVGLGRPVDFPLVWFSSAGHSWETVVPAARQSRGCPDGAVFSDGPVIMYQPGSDAQPVPLLDARRIRVPGVHNRENFMTALGLCLGLTDATTLARAAGDVADSFDGVPHRLELVRTHGGVRFYNSSIDSSPSRTCAALSAMQDLNAQRAGDGGMVPPPPIVICGGQDKHVPFDPLAAALCRTAKAVILTGEARGQIMAALTACPNYDPARLPVTVIPDWTEAMTAACRMASPGDTVLLSPACTSFDAFRNFEERGERFREIVNGLR